MAREEQRSHQLSTFNINTIFALSPVTTNFFEGPCKIASEPLKKMI